MRPERTHGRTWRWLKRGALGFVGLLALGVIAALIVMHTGWGRELVRAQVEDRLQTMFVGGASLGRVEGSPLSELTLHDLVINGPDGQPAISVGTLMVELGILPLLSRQARVLGVEAEDVDVDLRRGTNGELQIAHLMRPGPSSGWSVALPRVALRRAHVRFDTGTEVLNFDRLDIDARANMPHGEPLDASIELRGTWRERGGAPLDLRAAVNSDEGNLRLPYLVARAGDVQVVGTNVLVVTAAGHAPVVGGVVTVDATAAAIERLAPGVRLPADGALTVTATPRPGQPWTELGIIGRVDQTAVQFTGAVDLEARRARGVLVTEAVDLTKLTSGRIEGRAAVNASFDARPGGPNALPVAIATIRGWGEVAGIPKTDFVAQVSSAGERVQATIDATGPGVRAQVAASIRTVGELLAIDRATVHATVADPARASGGKAPVHGTLRIDLTASGRVRPTPSLAIKGTVSGRRLRMNDLSVAELHAAIDAGQLPNRPYGHAHVKMVDLVRGDMQLGALDVDATDRTDGKIAVMVRSRPKQNPWLLDADALVTPPKDAGPGTVRIDLQRHRVRVGNGTDWTGHTGRIEITPERIAVADLTSASERGQVAVSGAYQLAGRRRGDLAANLDVKGLALDNLGSEYRGKVDARVVVARQRGAWQGEVELDGTGIAIDPQQLTLDARARATLADRQLSVKADASSPGLGSAALAIDLEAPAKVEDPAAWKRLGRSAIRTGELTLRGIDVGRAAKLAGLVEPYAGTIDGDIRVSATTTGGRIEVRELVAPALRGLTIGAVLDLSQTSPSELTPSLTATAQGIGAVSAKAQLEMPDRLFDPAAWQNLGRRALRNATVRAENIAIDPAMLDRFGVTGPLRGRVTVVAEIGEAARSVQATVAIAELRGGSIVQPIDVRLEAATDDRATTSTLVVSSKGGRLLELQGRMPLSLNQLIDRSRMGAGAESLDAVLATPLSASARLVEVDAPRLLAVFGRSEVTAGALDGSIELTGTIGKPSVKANIVATGLKVPPGPGGKPVRTVERLALVASWDGTAAKVDIDGVESEGGTLKVAAEVNPSMLRDGRLTLQATKFDLVPVLAFAPGPAGGAAGRLDANLRVTGLDPRTMQIAGELHLLDARIPLAPSVGTLRRAKIDAVVADRQVTLAVDGRLGQGSVVVKGSVALDGAAPNRGKATITLRKVSPIGVVEPQITADIAATLVREGNQWKADFVVDRGSVVVPDDRGEKLDPVGAPTDMAFATGERITERPMEREAPVNPVVVATISLRSVRVESEEFRGIIKGKLEVRADGESIGVFGGIEADRGDLDLFGRRYYVERAAVYFDGSTDPLLDVRILHEFAEVTTITQVRGRASKPELLMSSDPGTYSQGQLLGFLLGGDPTGDPQAGAARDQVADAGASLIANTIGGYVRNALPIDIDVLRYEAASASSSAAVTVGTWVSHSLFLAYRQHLEARPDENTAEGEIEYWISKRLVLEGSAGNRGKNGLDLLWRKRY